MNAIFGKIMAKLFLKKKLPCYVISKEPTILMSYWLDFYKNHNKVISQLPDNKKSYLIFQLGYHVERLWRVNEIKNQFAQVQDALTNKKVDFIFLANSIAERDLLIAHGFSSVYCNQNAFLDETKYKVLENTKKKYDALYLARITPIKRQDLASEIKSLRLIGTYFKEEADFYNRCMRILKNATWKKKVWAFNVYKHMAQAHTGLCLSPEEGAMFVSTEYLLCGIPVVSTKSIGGRDVFFDPKYTRETSDEPKDIAKAVEDLKKLDLNPHTIRLETIEKMRQHRLAFVSMIQAIYDKEGIQKDFYKEWENVFIHKMGLRTSLPYEIAKERILTETRLEINQPVAA